MPTITPNLWFDTEAEEAARYYTSVFPSSEITDVRSFGEAGPGPEGSVMMVEFVLDGRPFSALNGGPQFSFTEAVSLVVDCVDQDEVDHYWATLSDGGEEGRCGWLKDRYGLSWQIVPAGLAEVFEGADAEGAGRAMEAMLGMGKLDLAALQAAAAGH